MSKQSDVIIIGGGIIGNATAYYLAKKGVSITVLEASKDIGIGGSSRNVGGVRQSGRDTRELPLPMWEIKNLWPGLSEELGVDVDYTQKGNLRLGKTEAHKKILMECLSPKPSLLCFYRCWAPLKLTSTAIRPSMAPSFLEGLRDLNPTIKTMAPPSPAALVPPAPSRGIMKLLPGSGKRQNRPCQGRLA